MDDNYFNIKGAILILQIISVHGEIMKETLLCTISEPTKHVPEKSGVGGGFGGGRVGLHTWGRICLTAHLKKTNDMPSDKMYGLFIHLHIYRKTCVSLSAISLALIPPSGGTSKQPPPPVWDVEKNEGPSLLTLSDEQRPDMAGNGYVSPFSLRVTHWNDRR